MTTTANKTTTRTVVSVERSLFEQVEGLAGELGVSRAQIIARALREFLEHWENRRLLAQINAAYAGEEAAGKGEEPARLAAMRRSQRSGVGREAW